MKHNKVTVLLHKVQNSIKRALTPQVRFIVLAENQQKGRKYQIMVRHNSFSLWKIYSKRWYKKPEHLKNYLNSTLPDHLLYLSQAQREAIKEQLAHRNNGTK